MITFSFGIVLLPLASPDLYVQNSKKSPYVVLRVLFSTVLVERIVDKFQALYSKNDVKRYVGGSPLFMDIPPEVTKVLLHSFTDLLASDFTTLAKYDPVDVPTGIPLLHEEPKIDQNLETDEDYEQKFLESVDKTKLIQDPPDDDSGSDESDEEGEINKRVHRSGRVHFKD